TVSVFSIAGHALTPVGKINLGDDKSGPSHVAITPDGKTALVTRDGDNKISVLSIDGNKVEYTKRDISAGLRPYGLVIHPNGKVAAVANIGTGSGDADTVSLIDIEAKPASVVQTVTVGQTPEGIVLSPDGAFAAVNVGNGSNKAKNSPWPTVSWVAGTTGETVRDTVQRMLIGRPGQEGTGAIPKDAIAQLVPARGIPDLLDGIRVRHESGGLSTIGIKSYLRGRESFQGETLDFLWFDEEPPPDVYFEALTRTNVSQGPIWLTFTPLTGVSTVVKRYLMERSPDRHITTMTIDDVGHFSESERAQIIDSYPEHEREARTRGVPTMGSGRIFTASEEDLLVDPFDIPQHWLRWGGCDFGWTHYAAFCELAWDRDLDIIYLIKTLRLKEQTPLQHAEAVRS